MPTSYTCVCHRHRIAFYCFGAVIDCSMILSVLSSQHVVRLEALGACSHASCDVHVASSVIRVALVCDSRIHVEDDVVLRERRHALWWLLG